MAQDALTTATRDAALTAAGFLLIGLVATATLGAGRRDPVAGTPARQAEPANH